MHITVFWFLIHYYWNISFYYFAGNLDNLNNLSGMNIHSQILIPLKWLVKKEMNTKKKRHQGCTSSQTIEGFQQSKCNTQI